MVSQPQHYLVVDDDSTNNLICNFIIQKYDKNSKIELYLIPEKALLYIEQNFLKPDKPIPTILFLDVNMPTMSGFEFLDEFKKFDKEIQQQFTIYMLSSSIEDFNSRAKEYPFVSGFLSKPLQVSHLETIWNP